MNENDLAEDSKNDSIIHINAKYLIEDEDIQLANPNEDKFSAPPSAFGVQKSSKSIDKPLDVSKDDQKDSEKQLSPSSEGHSVDYTNKNQHDIACLLLKHIYELELKHPQLSSNICKLL